MVIADIKQFCEACGGNGSRLSVPLVGTHQNNPTGRCHLCQGRGWILTPLGKDLWETFEPLILELLGKKSTDAPKKRNGK